MMNSDEIFSENVLVTNEDLQGFPSVQTNFKEIVDETKNVDSIPNEQNNMKSTSDKSITSDNQDLFDVIIVGAGISGLSSAYFMKKKHPNLKMLIIEAKDRVIILFFKYILLITNAIRVAI